MKEKSYAKVNIFLKIKSSRDNYHEIVSRFVKINNLYDEIFFEKKECTTFELYGNFSCSLKENTIYKAYILLKNEFKAVKTFFNTHCVKVEKNIPEYSGLGGGSSNVAVFMLMINKVCTLDLSKDELAKRGVKIGADVPFFIYEFNSANVSGIGEIVEEFNEKLLNIEIFTSNVQCSTKKIFELFRAKFYKEVLAKDEEFLLKSKSKDILAQFDKKYLNDLYSPAVEEYKELEKYSNDTLFFSGSGSSFFKIRN